MTAAIRHRGPDAAGTWVDGVAGVALGHARLSVIDLTDAAGQPMRSRDGRYIITYNGEIYNYRTLRQELEGDGAEFKSHSDTEVLLEAISRWGLASTLGRLNGMFAFGLWDAAERQLTLARDRLGEKPLYYFAAPGAFVFASDLAAMREHPAVCTSIDRDSLALFLRYNNVPAPWSILQGTRKLLPASLLVVSCRDGIDVGRPSTYWSPWDQEPAEELTDGEAVEMLDALLFDAVRLRLESDVPVGAFLSGGVDSSSIVAMMKRATSTSVRTFTIGSDHTTHDESVEADRVAQYLGTDHTSVRVSATDALNVIPLLPRIYSEPFADSSQIPTYLVSALARRQVTVSLSGDGGDELFGGYNRHRWVSQVWHRTHRLPISVRRGAAALMNATPPAAWRHAATLVPQRHRPRTLELKVQKLGRVIDQQSAWAMYQTLLSQWREPSKVVLGANEPITVATSAALNADGTDLQRAMMNSDLRTYLPDDILVKVDRASMAVSLEARVPMLDHRLVEMALSLPLRMKVRDRTSKWVLRQVLSKYVPTTLSNRPKSGFGVPIAEWLRGPLRGWADQLLDPSTLRRQGYFEAQPIMAAWRAHTTGRQDRSYELWSVLMFQQWLEHTQYLDSRS